LVLDAARQGAQISSKDVINIIFELDIKELWKNPSGNRFWNNTPEILNGKHSIPTMKLHEPKRKPATYFLHALQKP